MTPGGGKDDARYRREFLAETEGLLDQAREALAEMERAGADPPPGAVNGLFRAIHSLKGIAAMTGLGGIAAFSHDLEALLDALRMGRVAFTRSVLAAVSRGVEVLAGLAERVQNGEGDPPAEAEDGDRLRRALRSGTPAAGAGTAAAPSLPAEIERMLTDYERHRIGEAARRGCRLVLFGLELALESFEVSLRLAMDEVGSGGELIGTFPGGAGPDSSRMVFRLLGALQAGTSAADLGLRIGARSVEELGPQDGPPAARGREADDGEGDRERQAGAAATARSLGGTVRVPLEKLGLLLNLTGELAFSRWAMRRSLEKALASATDRTARLEAQKAFNDLDRTVTALGRAALATRLVPVEQLTARLSRTVASIAASLGKDLEFEVFGGETEVDKVLAEELADPLLHIVRNAVDHGIETPAERRAAGKPPAGRVTLTVEARGRSVVFAFADDGRGMDGAKLVRAAREKGILSPGEPDPADPFELVFRPGFSTAATVSELSGRGVGLDVVRSNLARLKGEVRVASTPGRGTTFEVEVPMSLVLVESLLVRTQRHTFAVPTTGVRRAFRTDPSRVHREGLRTVVDDEGESLPLFSLAGLLGLGDAAGFCPTVVVVEQGARRAGFSVSSIEGMEDVIVKPLSEAIPRSRGIVGASELPGGNLALTLDTGLLLDAALSADAHAGGAS